MSTNRPASLHRRQCPIEKYIAQKIVARFLWFRPWITLILLLLTSCQGGVANLPEEVATPENPAISPSGEYILVVVSGHDGQVRFHSFQILNQHRKVVYLSAEHFTAHHRTYFLWDQDNRVWVYSSDVGIFFWKRKSDTDVWKKHDGSESNTPKPEFLRQAVPN